MITIILSAVALAVVVGIVLAIKAKGKTHTERSSSESIAYTISQSLKRGIRDLEKGIRSPEVVRSEIIQKFDEAKKEMVKNLEVYLTEIITAKMFHQDIIDRSKAKCADLKSKAKEFKTMYESSNDKRHMQYAEKYVGLFIAQEKQVSDSKRIVEDMEFKIVDAKAEYDIMISSLQVKRANILSMITSPSVNFSLINFEIDDLTSELKEKTAARNVEISVQNTISEVNGNISQPQIDREEIRSALEQL